MQYRNSLVPVSLFACTACTGQVPGSFRLAQLQENFASTQQINTKLDMLFVIDNSASMDVSQKTLRDGFGSFAAKYMKPTWDIQVAAITTDTFLAHPAFSGYLNTTFQGSGYTSTYLSNRMSYPPGGTEAPANPLGIPFQDPPYPNWIAGTINSSGKLTRNLGIQQAFPSWGPNWGLLLAGNHDGPMVSLCYENNTYFFWGESQCFIRDKSSNRGPSHCIAPQGSEDSTTQCVNTFMNDTIHTNTPIISTIPPEGTPTDASWERQLAQNFIINVSTGSSGSGSERGFNSLLQLIKDNEEPATRKANANPFFRPDSLRVIVFLSDEDDQSIGLDGGDPLDPAPLTPTSPFSGYISAGGSCPIAPGSPQTPGCCATKTVDGYTYSIPICPKGYPAATTPTAGAVLMPVAHVKTRLDAFFRKLDGLSSPPAQPSYFVAAIVLINGNSIKKVREEGRCPEQTLIFGSCDPFRDASSDRGDRYLQLVDLVGNGSLSMDFSASDYTPILDAIGQSVLTKKASITLTRAPTGSEDMIVMVQHSDGTMNVVQPSQYSISDKTLTFTDQALILSLSATDQIAVNYQPRTVY